MAVLQASGLADLISSTLPELGRLKLTDASTKYHDTIALQRIFTKKKRVIESGTSIKFNIQYDIGGSARFVPLGFTAESNIKNTLTVGEVPWRGMTWNWSMIAEEEVMNSGQSRILHLMNQRRNAEYGSAIVLCEQQLWATPDASDELAFFPIPYYIVKSNTAVTTNDGFNGLVPTGFTTVASVNPSSLVGRNYRNYATQYTAVAKNDLIRKMRRGAKYTKFKPLVQGTPTYDSGDDFGWYTNYAVTSVVEEILESQNENLGTDAASMDGKAMVRRAMLETVQELDVDTTNPVYGIYWGNMHPYTMRGFWNKVISIGVNPNQPEVATVHNVSRFNIVCEDRRRQMVFATDTTMP